MLIKGALAHFWNYAHSWLRNRKYRHFDEILTTGWSGGTESCQQGNFLCSQWWELHQISSRLKHFCFSGCAMLSSCTPFWTSIAVLISSRNRLKIKMSSYQSRLHNWIPLPGKTVFILRRDPGVHPLNITVWHSNETWMDMMVILSFVIFHVQFWWRITSLQ